ncbi:hypothetical protein PH210_25950 [Paenibacillus sp. BSR1-1]|uniref:hypothetical protein n=1 Tax=Paenibacillus sp. BSR1-1 TaxID=3020845 RepID=UPI0025B03DB6|nr:hypothetical protein [Paenibacillus sp. BSR1-1]MDN3019613.1 hypothetical protein [Paenibacillus sp. BSR1-1]
MTKTIILISCLFVSFSIPSLHAHADFPRLTAECKEMAKLRDDQFTTLVMKDIISGFNLDIDDSSYIEITDRDLDAANLIYGGKENDDYYNSLKQHFIVASRGKPRLFVRPKELYLLYKEPDNTNVMVHFKLQDSRWDVIERKKMSGKEIPYKLLDCEIEYLNKKKDYYAD